MSFGFGGGGFGSNNQSSGFGTGTGFGSSNTTGGRSFLIPFISHCLRLIFNALYPSFVPLLWFSLFFDNTPTTPVLLTSTRNGKGDGDDALAQHPLRSAVEILETLAVACSVATRLVASAAVLVENQGGALFGGQNRAGGFGTTNTSTTPSLFGGGAATNTANTGFGTSGGFGSSTGGGFGSSAATNTAGGLFGNKTAGGFGSTNTSTTGGFGTGGGFGSGAAPTSTGFGGSGTAFQAGAPVCEGTGGTPFNAFTEKDSNSSATNHYQSISFMQPYSKFSFEELRLADYQQGRRFGNGSGQAGGFGTPAFGGSTGGFGSQQPTSGFGTSTTTPFGGATTAAPSGFGATQTAGAFGNTGGSNPLFGGNKPANNMFGGGTTTGTGQTSLFGGGSATGATGGFGSSNTGTGGAFGGTSGGLFGNNAQQQNKPAFGAGSTGSAFGGGGFGTQQTTTAANPFGGTTATASPFGQQQQTGTTAFGGTGFGNTQNQTQNKPGGLFGGGGGSTFGATPQQQQTGTGLFGSGATTGAAAGGNSLFGGNQNQQQQQGTGSLFGGGQTQQPGTTGGLFGAQNQQQKPAGGLFGGGTATTGSTFGSTFGNTQSQPATGGLFGNNQAQQQKPGGLFSGSTGAGSTGGLFGAPNSTNQAGGSSLFGGNQSQQQQTAGSSLFGSSQPAQQVQQPAPGSLQASLLEGNPYGSQSIFSGLPTPSAPSPGPLATPLSSSIKQKQRTPLPVYKITPNAANRLITPPPKRQGYGFSYSTYGSPSSTTSTPGSGMGGSLLGGSGGAGSLRGSINGSFGRSFSKSYSTSNLRKSFLPEDDSILSPGALQPGSARSSGSGLKRLTIDRSLRNDLFTPRSTTPATITNGDDSHPADKLKKKVSFDSTPSEGQLVRVESRSPEPTPDELGFLRSVRKSGSLNGIDEVSNRPEMESTRRDLAVVPENDEPTTAGSTVKRLTFIPSGDPKPGEYWMSPSFADLSKMTRDQLKKVVDFTVGRQNCGQVTFNGPVDLTTIDLDNIFDKIVDIGVRKITVYPDENIKPPMGKGLNVPSTLSIENSWPRGRDRKNPLPITSGPLFDKHIDRLRKVTDTEFVTYEVETGTWVFNVPHFTTYGLDYDEDEGENHDQSTLGAGPDDTRTPKAQPDHPPSFEQSATFSIDESFVGSMVGVDDDTFDFKKRKIVPGSFGSQAMGIEDHDMESEGETDSFLDHGSTGSTTEHDDDVTESHIDGDSVVGSDEDQTMDMAGSFPDLRRTVERDDSQSITSDLDTTYPISKPFGTPEKPRLDLSGDWAEQLQRTISPRKQNRDALRQIQANAFTDRPLLDDESLNEKSTSSPKKSFSTSIDLMNSLFQQQPRKQSAPSQLKASKSQSNGFEWPYNKQPKTFAGDSSQMDKTDAAFYNSFKPRWGPMDTIVCAKNDITDPLSDSSQRWTEKFSIFSEGRDIAVMKYTPSITSTEMLDVQKHQSTIQRVDGTPLVRLSKIDLRQFALSPAKDEERLVWQLANILFNDDIEDDISASVPAQLRSKFAHRIKKDRLTRLWQSVIREKHAHTLDSIRSPEERAVHLLCSHRVEEACKTLVESQNLHLATVVAQIGRDAISRADMANQIDVWRQSNVLSEMSEPVRALYELVAGNSIRSEGKSGGALEDRASTFVFTERFELDWFQAFGLRLWYGITEDEPIEAAVSKYLDDLSTGVEPAFPYPSHCANDQASLQPGSDTTGRESPLWVLLKAYSAANGQANFQPLELPAALLPEAVSGDRLKNRLSFQLHHLLATAIGQNEMIKINQAQADRLTWDFASEMLAGGELENVLFVLLHLSQTEDRKRAVQDTLSRFGALLPDPTAQDGSGFESTWLQLTVELQIPEAWIWIAKALHARDSGDAIREVDCLIRGKHWNDAHATFCRAVGPTAVISRDYHTLDRLVSGFGDGPERKIRGWASGGGIYEDFLRLATAPRGRRDPTRLSRLVNALVAMGDRVRTGQGIHSLEERVAFKEMSRAVAGWITREDVQSVESSAVLGLPLTGDARVLQTVEMSRRYYGIIMAGGH
ncbi:hypothetical protein N7462_007534 [Penicillium macrosclerotiorum]|uniref:uncharacterized protein n=1 Tax=Penicillium macrosclerotiorum TaxID=303699 RepID=UPI002547A39F|nr:uncharacterized protein N7462_007534 [Penicillium macrosclerotiorum]KAJ5679290.1 hypothetical protein N7462_007534 [Penicillium macrosclerotiorum]